MTLGNDVDELMERVFGSDVGNTNDLSIVAVIVTIQPHLTRKENGISNEDDKN